MLQEWNAAGLREESAFRVYLVTLNQRDARSIVGRLTAKDWEAVQECVARALAIPSSP